MIDMDESTKEEIMLEVTRVLVKYPEWVRADLNLKLDNGNTVVFHITDSDNTN
jgi:hypothetical protein